jgi:hypothetical protein
MKNKFLVEVSSVLFVIAGMINVFNKDNIHNQLNTIILLLFSIVFAVLSKKD